MFITNVLLKNVKGKQVMVLLKSTGSTHKRISFRERLDDKKEIIAWDPYIQMQCVYKEFKKLKSRKKEITIREEFNAHTYGIIPKELMEEK